MCRPKFWQLVGVVALAFCSSTFSYGQLTELAFYHLGEDDPGATVGGDVLNTIESLGTTPDLDMEIVFAEGVTYSADTPAGIDSTMSVDFGDQGDYLATFATPWHEDIGSFRVGMEAFLKVDSSMMGSQAIPFGNGTGYHIEISPDGFYSAVGSGTTGNGITPVKYDEWQHVAFITGGSTWQVYVDGVAQFDPLPEFFYNAPDGDATIGSSLELSYEGLIDEHRVFTWTGAFNPADLLWFSGRNDAGDVNEDGSVNQADYDIWRANVDADLTGMSILEGRALGDLDGNGQVDLDDFGIIKENKSAGVVFNTSVPEPASCLLLLVGLATAISQRRRKSSHLLTAALLVVSLLFVSQPQNALAQATWGGGDGNWTDANWTGGSGTGGAPAAGDAIVLPASTGTLTVSSDLGLTYATLAQQGGILDIESSGALEFSGDIQNGLETDTSGELILAGELIVGGGFDVARTVAARVTLKDSAVLQVTNNLDTWWGGVAQLDVIGSNVDVEVGGLFYLGPGANLNANIDGNSFSTIKVPGELSLQGGFVNVNFDGVTPAVGDSWTLFDATTSAGQITGVTATGQGPGIVMTANYGAGGNLGQVVTLDAAGTLNLTVDTVTGNATINNPASGTSDFDIDGYIIRSASDSLNDAGLTGVGETGWQPGLAPSQSSGLLSESNFNDSTVVSDTSAFDIGGVFDITGTQDLTFEYHLAGGETLQGTVEYVASAADADFDIDNDVDGADFLSWQRGHSATSGAGLSDGDANSDGAVNGADLAIWEQQFGTAAVSAVNANAVPEPTSLALGLSMMVALVARRRVAAKGMAI